MQVITVNDVSEYVKAITQVNEADPKDEFHRPKELLFRGQSDEGYELIPSLGRYKNGREDLCFVAFLIALLPKPQRSSLRLRL